VLLRKPPRARAGLLVTAIALIAFAASATTASAAATLNGGTLTPSIKLTGVKVTLVKGPSKSTLDFGTGSVTTFGSTASGSIAVAGTDRQIKLKYGSKSLVLSKIIEKLVSGKGSLTVTAAGKSVSFFNEASSGKVKPNADFTKLDMSKSNLTLTKLGAAALNKAFGLKKPAAGKPDKRFKDKGKAGTIAFSADRELKVVSGEARTAYDTAFYDKLKASDCDVTLNAIAPATAIPADGTNPRGGVVLPASSGALNATTLKGQVGFTDAAGTSLDRPAGSGSGKAEYHGKVTKYRFGLGVSPLTLGAFSSDAAIDLQIGTIEGATVSKALTATGGTVTVSNGNLKLSDIASGALAQFSGCSVPAGSSIGVANLTANVE
jgi:hypothetical protein